MSVWEAARYGKIAELQHLAEEGISILSQRHPIPEHIHEKAKAEAEWIEYTGQKRTLKTIAGQWTPLHVACAFKQTATVEWMISQKIPIDQKDQFPHLLPINNETPKKKVKKIPENQKTSGWNALHWAAHVGQIQILSKLLKANFVLTAYDKKILKPILQYTTINNHENQVLLQKLYTWGSGSNYALGNGTNHNRTTPYIVNSGKEFSELNVIDVSVSKYFTICVCLDMQSDDTSIWSWGKDKDGCLGHPNLKNQTIPFPSQIKGLTGVKITKVVAGVAHCCLVSSVGELYTFGSGDFGKLGHGDFTSCSYPKLVESLSTHDITDVGVGDHHTIALTAKGLLYTWGCGSFGQTGLNTFDDCLTPRMVPNFVDQQVSKIFAGTKHSFVISNDDKLFYFGMGQNSPKLVTTPSGVQGKISCVSTSNEHILLLSKFGGVYYSSFRREEKLINTPTRSNLNVNQTIVVVWVIMPFKEIDLQGASGKLISCVGEKLVIYDNNNQIREWSNGDPFSKNVNFYTLDHVIKLKSSGYHCAAIITQPLTEKELENRLVQSTHQNDFTYALKNRLFSDFIIVSGENNRFYVHKFLLEFESPYFCQLFKLEKEIRSVHLEDVNSSILSIILELLYSGATSFSCFMSNDIRKILKKYKFEKLLQKLNKLPDGKNLKSVNFPPLRFKDILKESNFYDVIVETETDRISCHQTVLASRSKFFEMVLTSNCKESNEGIIQLPMVPTNVAQQLVEFCYTDEVEAEMGLETIIDLLIVSNEYLMDRVKYICEEMLVQHIDFQTLILFLELSSLHNAEFLKKQCYNYILAHLYETIDSGIFEELSTEVVNDLQTLIDFHIKSVTSSKYLRAAHPNYLFPTEKLQAMEDEFLFSSSLPPVPATVQKVKAKANTTVLSEDESVVLAKYRSLKKKVQQIQQIEAKKQRGDNLLPEQLSKMYQKPYFLQQIDKLMKDNPEAFIKFVKYENQQNSNSQAKLNQKAAATPIPGTTPASKTSEILPETLPAPASVPDLYPLTETPLPSSPSLLSSNSLSNETESVLVADSPAPEPEKVIIVELVESPALPTPVLPIVDKPAINESAASPSASAPSPSQPESPEKYQPTATPSTTPPVATIPAKPSTMEHSKPATGSLDKKSAVPANANKPTQQNQKQNRRKQNQKKIILNIHSPQLAVTDFTKKATELPKPVPIEERKEASTPTPAPAVNPWAKKQNQGQSFSFSQILKEQETAKSNARSPGKSPPLKTSPVPITTPPQLITSPSPKGWNKLPSPVVSPIQLSPISLATSPNKTTATPISIQSKTQNNTTSPIGSLPNNNVAIPINYKKKNQRSRSHSQKDPQTLSVPSQQLPPVKSAAVLPVAQPQKRQKVSLSEIMAEEQEKARQNQRQYKPKPKLRDIMVAELVEKQMQSPFDVSVEQKLLELALQASLEEQ